MTNIKSKDDKMTNEKSKHDPYGLMDVIRDELAGNAQYVDADTYQKRVDICMKCNHRVEPIPFTGGNCGLCGCFIKTKNKYRQSQCPDKPPRWSAC